MKLASLTNGTRDGRLVLVSKDLTRYTDASFLTPTLQAALDDWTRIAPHLARRSARASNSARSLSSAFTSMTPCHRCRAPISGRMARPMSIMSSWCAKRAAREMPESFWTDPLIYQGGSDSFLGPRDPIGMADEAYGIDMEGEVAVIVDEVPMGASTDEAREAIRLIMLVNDVSACARSFRQNSPRVSASSSPSLRRPSHPSQ